MNYKDLKPPDNKDLLNILFIFIRIIFIKWSIYY